MPNLYGQGTEDNTKFNKYLPRGHFEIDWMDAFFAFLVIFFVVGSVIMTAIVILKEIFKLIAGL